MSVYGNILHLGEVEDAVTALLQKYISTYLAELERQLERPVGSIGRPRTWNTAFDLDNWPVNTLPIVSVVAASTGDVTQNGAGGYSTRVTFGVGAVISGQTQKNTRELTQIYGAAIRAAIAQHGSLDGFSDGTEWLGEEYRDLGEANRNLGVSINRFSTMVSNVLNRRGGLTAPEPVDNTGNEPAESPEWTHVGSTQVTVQNIPVTNDV